MCRKIHSGTFPTCLGSVCIGSGSLTGTREIKMASLAYMVTKLGWEDGLGMVGLLITPSSLLFSS